MAKNRPDKRTRAAQRAWIAERTLRTDRQVADAVNARRDAIDRLIGAHEQLHAEPELTELRRDTDKGARERTDKRLDVLLRDAALLADLKVAEAHAALMDRDERHKAFLRYQRARHSAIEAGADPSDLPIVDAERLGHKAAVKAYRDAARVARAAATIAIHKARASSVRPVTAEPQPQPSDRAAA